MRCNEYYIWMSGHLDGTNSEKEEQSLQAHLAACPQCREALENMKANDAILQRDPLTPPERVCKNVMASVRKDAKRKSNRLRSYIVSFAAAAAVLCLVLIASLRIPERPDTESTTAATNNPTEETLGYALTEAMLPPTYALEDIPVEGAAVAAETRSTRGVGTHTDPRYHCVFVEFPSRDMVPQNFTPLALEEFYTCVTREALDAYFYGGSIIYGATLMTYEEISQWEDQIQWRFLQENPDSDTYVVVFCSESR